MKLADKIEDFRMVPLTPYVAYLLAQLPRRNEWVFSSSASADGRIAEPRYAHNEALKAAGLPHITLHGLRRSFATLSEWVEMPAGIAAQIQLPDIVRLERMIENGESGQVGGYGVSNLEFRHRIKVEAGYERE